MKRLKPTANEHSWPRKAVPSIECRKRDLVIRIADWRRTEASAFDVECYIGGIYDWNESKSCETKADAIAYAQAQVAKLL